MSLGKKGWGHPGKETNIEWPGLAKGNAERMTNKESQEPGVEI